MSFAPYSVTFCRNWVANAWVIYTVPAGYRAVVRWAGSSNAATAGVITNVAISGRYVCHLVPPAAWRTAVQELMVVAYAGETIELFNQAVASMSWVSGYLLREVASQAGSYGPVALELDKRPEPLPS
jgi:hypothetical protein